VSRLSLDHPSSVPFALSREAPEPSFSADAYFFRLLPPRVSLFFFFLLSLAFPHSHSQERFFKSRYAPHLNFLFSSPNRGTVFFLLCLFFSLSLFLRSPLPRRTFHLPLKPSFFRNSYQLPGKPHVPPHSPFSLALFFPQFLLPQCNQNSFQLVSNSTTPA